MTEKQYFKDYASYAEYLTLEELEAKERSIDKEKEPERYKVIVEAIRKRTEEGASQTQGSRLQLRGPREELALQFHGSSREYFRIWIVNLCLTLVTAGVFSAWAKVRKKRYAYSHITIGGTPFQYLGQPIPILKGRLIAATGFLVYYISSHFMTLLMPWVLGSALVVAPWVVVRSAAFNARYSAFRNMTFHFHARYLDAVKAIYAWGIVPFLIIGMIFAWKGRAQVLGIAALVFAFSFPFWMRRLKRFIVEYTSYGGEKGAFFATGSQFYKIYFLSALIAFGLAIPSGILVAFTIGSEKQMWVVTYVSPLLVYVGYVVAYAFIRARTGNLVWNKTRLGPLRFQCTLRCRDLTRLYLTNALGIILSLGLLIPWAVIRTWKYRADNMRVWHEGELTVFKGTDSGSVTALGAETLDFFDVDLSL